jgi:hypothetical protein
MSGHEQHEAGVPEEDHSINIKVGVFFVFVLLSLFVIALIGS